MKSNLIKLIVFCFISFNELHAQNPILVGAQEPDNKQISDVIDLPGTVLANESVKITSVVSEKIKRILFQEGKFVKKNQLLVELLDNEEKAIFTQANAELDEAIVNYNRALKLSEKGNISRAILDNRLMVKKNYQEKLKK